MELREKSSSTNGDRDIPWGMITDEKYKLNVVGMKKLRSMCRAKWMDRWRNEEVRDKVDVRESISRSGMWGV